ncbi:Helicase ATP-binding domain-containing protein [Balamuthia mandrillaris]
MAFLAQQGVDIDVIEKSQRLDVGIADLPSIKKTRNLLEDLIAKHPSVELFYKEIDAFGADEIKAFISNLGPRDIFLPTRERALKKLRSIEWSSLPRMRIARHLRCCEEALEHLQLEKRLLMNGTTKDLTTEWWLTLIKDECDKFLVRRGFNFDATAYDYIADPPSDPRAVLDNLKLIKEILNPNEDKHNVQKLIKRLKEQIYPKIDLFINNAQIVLAEQFRMDYDNFSLEEAEAKFHNEKDKLEDVSRNWIEDMLKDIQYLKEMKRLEKPQNCKEKILDIVPVTGLIVGRFYRLENELRTVIEQWDEIFEEFEAAEAKAKQDQELQQLLQTQFLETNASANYTNSSAASTPTNTSSSSLPLPTSNNNQSSSASSPASSIIVSGTNSSSSEGGHHHSSSSVLQGASTPSSSSPSSSSVESSPRTEKREPRKNRLSVEMKIKQAKPKAAKRTNHS